MLEPMRCCARGGAHHGGFYSRFGNTRSVPLLEAHPDANALNSGRSCVLRLSQQAPEECSGTASGAMGLRHRIDVMLAGEPCGTDPRRSPCRLVSSRISARPPEEWCARARCAFASCRWRACARRRSTRGRRSPSLPPLIKGNLRLGARFGDGAWSNSAIGTTDLFVVLPALALNPRYVTIFGADAGRHA